MAISRRTFVVSGISLSAVGICTLFYKKSFEQISGKLVSGFEKDGPPTKPEESIYYFAYFDSKTKEVKLFNVPMEIHSCIQHPLEKDTFIAFGQRPSPKSVVVKLFNKGEKAEITVFEATPDRHFYGHGGFIEDGKSFLCTENNFNDGQGIIVKRNFPDLKPTGEFSSHGIGPHEMLFINDETIAVANGGDKTHPLYKNGRSIMNKDSMNSSLNLINYKTGLLEREINSPYPKVKMKHLSFGAGILGCAMQFGSDEDRALYLEYGVEPIVLFYHIKEKENVFAKMNNKMFRAMAGHSLSIAINKDGVAAVTSPRGNLLTFWNTHDGSLIDKMEMRWPTGVCTAKNKIDFIVGSRDAPIYICRPTYYGFAKNELQFSNIEGKGGRWGSHFLVVKEES